MKPFYIVLLLLIPFFTLAQENQQKDSKHKISLSIFDPIKIPGNDAYFNDGWLYPIVATDIVEKELHYRNYTRFAVGLSYEYALKNNFSIAVDLGMGIRLIDQGNIVIDSPNELSKDMWRGDISYKQYSYGINLIGVKSFSLKNFQFNLGLGPSYWMQGKGIMRLFSQDYYISYHIYTHHYTEKIQSYANDMTFGSGHNIGLGTRLGIDYNFTPSFAVGVDVSWFVFYSIYKNSVKSEGIGHTFIHGSKEGVMMDETSELLQETNIKFQQFSFSNLSPRLKVMFKF